jgi:TonB family protein
MPEEAVLVRFGGTNWGKLINISEEGMSFEFAQAPANAKTIAFQIESMCGESAGPGESRSAVQVDGWVKWSSEFERTAGVQFVGLSKDARQQIRQWFPAEDLSEMLAEDETGAEESLKSYEAPGVRQEQRIERQSIEQAGTASANAHPDVEETVISAATINRTAVLVASACLMIVAALTAIAVFRFTPARAAVNSQNIQRASAGEDVSAGDGLPTFKVEVVQAAGGRFLLNFSDNASAKAVGGAPSAEMLSAPAKSSATVAAKPQLQTESAAGIPATLSSTSAMKMKRPLIPSGSVGAISIAAPVLDTATKKEPEPSAKSQAIAESAVAALKAVPIPAMNAPKEVSAPSDAVIPGRAAKPLENREKGIVGSTTKAISGAVKPVGGQAQPARLISSVPPVYPPFARSERIMGNVLIDALIDLNGKVTNMKVLSGPDALREAAKNALKEWRFEPAQLNGAPISTHLEVTVKFQLVDPAKQQIR